VPSVLDAFCKLLTSFLPFMLSISAIFHECCFVFLLCFRVSFCSGFWFLLHLCFFFATFNFAYSFSGFL